MKICIYGAGAVGGLMAAWLSRAGHEVSLVARGRHLEAILRHGLKVRDRESGEVRAYRLAADADPVQLGQQDYVIVAVKGHSLTDVAARIAPLLGPDTSIVTAMNGVPWWFFDRLGFHGGRERLETLDPGGALSAAMPTERIVGCVVHFAASTPEPGLVSHNMGRRLIIGEPGGKNGLRAQRIANALEAAGFEVGLSPAIEKDFWVKLLGNVSFNPVSALTLGTADRLIEDPHVKAYLVGIMREVLAIGRAVGVDADIDPEARIDMARALGPFKTSMLQDLEAGKPLEIDGLLAGTLEIAAKAGVAAPLTEALFGLIRARAATTGQYRPASPMTPPATTTKGSRHP
ncbi:MAG TPA: 2-dehydropantoate 2-reductase [Burkholderiales bacterium]|nr:2-dehydropantoate 2-reductase [Burkholderiales bacterium]